MSNDSANTECKLLEEALNAYLDGEALGEEKEAVESHLQSCAPCRKHFEELRRTKSVVKVLKRMDAPAEIWEKILTEINRKNVVSLQRRVSRVALAAAAALFFFLTLVTFIGYFSPEQTASDENVYAGSHAYQLMHQPLSDHASWSYVSEKSGFALFENEE